jgi:hypothetical protein
LYTVLECPKLHLRALTISIKGHQFFSFKATAFFTCTL